MQARKAPPIIEAKKSINSGAIGKIISTNFLGCTNYWSQFFYENFLEYAKSINAGINLLTVPVGLDLDAFAFVLGEFKFLNAMVKTQFKDMDVVGTDNDEKNVIRGNKTNKDTSDQVLAQGVL